MNNVLTGRLAKAFPVKHSSLACYFFSVFFLISIGFYYVLASPPLSPIDEHVHIDYALKAGQLHLPGENERLGQETLEIMACSRLDVEGLYVPPCNQGEFHPDVYPDYGYNTAAESQPTYYLVTGLLARTLRILTPIDGLLVSLRIANWLWIVGASTLLLRSLLDSQVKPMVSLGLSLCFALNPVIFAAGLHVSPDASLPIAGWILFKISTAPFLTLWKTLLFTIFTGILLTLDRAASLALVLALVILAARSSTEIWRKFQKRSNQSNSQISLKVLLCSGMLISYFLIPLVLLRVRTIYSGSIGARTDALPRDSWFQRPNFSLEAMFNGFWNLFPPVQGGYLTTPMRNFESGVLSFLLAVVLIGGLFAIMSSSAQFDFQLIGTVVFTVGLFSFPILNFALWLSGGDVWQLSPRFAISPILSYFFLTGIALNSRFSRIAVNFLTFTLVMVVALNVVSFASAS